MRREVHGLEAVQQHPLLEAEVRLHDRLETLQVPVHPVGRLLAAQRRLELADEVTHHRVILRQPAQGVVQLGVGCGDGREEVPVLPFVVQGQRGAETPAVEEEVAHHLRFGRVLRRRPHEVECLAEAAVDRPQLVRQRDGFEARPWTTSHLTQRKAPGPAGGGGRGRLWP